MKRLLFAFALVLAGASCGDDKKAEVDAPPAPPDTPPDTPPQPKTLTTFVIDIVTNETKLDNAPHPFDDFKDLPDPDGDMNNTAAYAPLFP